MTKQGKILLGVLIVGVCYWVVNSASNTSEPTSVVQQSFRDDPPRNAPEAIATWEVSTLNDDFGDPTDQKVITNVQPFDGSFSNSAVNNADLGVEFICSPDNIVFKLYKVAYQSYFQDSELYDDDWKIKVKFGNGESAILYAHTSGTRFVMDEPKKLHEILIKGGRIHFAMRSRFRDDEGPTFDFLIDDASGYNRVYSELSSGS